MYFFFLVKRAGRHFGFFKRAGRHEKGAGRRALQKKPRQNTAVCVGLFHGFRFVPWITPAILNKPKSNKEQYEGTREQPKRIPRRNGRRRQGVIRHRREERGKQ